MIKNGISVIILTYKGRNQLESCLNSVISSLRHPDDEIIVTEDGEDSKTRDIIHSVKGGSQSPIKHLTQPDTDMRAATARNKGFLSAQNETILFIDHDILLPPDFLKQLARYHRPHWVTAARRFFLNPKSTEKILNKTHPLTKAFSLNTKFRAIVGRWEGWRHLLPLRNRLPGGIPQSWRGAATFCVAVSRREFIEVDGFDSRYDGIYAVEDWDLFARLEHAGVKFGYLPFGATVAHLHHKRSDHDLQSRNYQILDQVLAEKAITASSGLSKVSKTD